MRSLAPEGTGAALLVEVDGIAATSRRRSFASQNACRAAGAIEVLRAATDAEREELWRVRRELSPSLKTISPLKFNHDVVVPRGRMPELFDLIAKIKREWRLRIPCFGHAGDGNIHVNIMVDPDDEDEARAGARGRTSPLRGRRRARGLDQRRARHRVRQGAVPAARAVARSRSP